MASERPADVVELPGAGVPADRGLAALGLLMQLAGGTFAACGGLAALAALVALREHRAAPPAAAAWVLVAVALCVARSLVHRAAGDRLLYQRRPRADGTPASPLDGVRRYVAVALGQTVLLALVCHGKLGVPAGIVLAGAAGLAVWPLVLAGILASGALARLAAGIPHGDDKGFEGASILMAVLGAAGVLATGASLLAQLGAGPAEIVHGPGVVVVAALLLLLVRAGLHLQAGLGGLRETSLDRSVDLANRYAGFGVVSSLWFGGVLLLGAIANGLDVWGMTLVAGLGWLMMLWPLTVRRFFGDRQFAALLAGGRAALHRRAPDAGLTGLGWLLVGHAALTASFLLPQLLAGPALAGDALAGDARHLAALAAGIGDGSPWWSAGVVVLEAWAGTELLRMGAHHRVVAAAYGVAGVLVTLALTGPILRDVLALSVLGGGGDRLVLSLALIALQLAIPAAALLLATRTVAPAARARYRRGAAQTVGPR
jgi:hypothetical protein